MTGASIAVLGFTEIVLVVFGLLLLVAVPVGLIIYLSRQAHRKESKYTAHRDVRLNLGCMLWVTFTGGIGAIVSGLTKLPSMQALGELVVGVGLIAVTLGIWYAKEWARWAAGILAAYYALGSLAVIAWAVAAEGQWEKLIGLVFVGLFGLLAWYAFLPSTRQSFADARELIARSRAPARPR